MPARKPNADAESKEPTPYISREDAAGLTGDTGEARTAPDPVPPGDDQVEVTLPDGTTGVVDKVVADAMKAAEGKRPVSVKSPPPDAPAQQA